jgi:hypothetical protein
VTAVAEKAKRSYIQNRQQTAYRPLLVTLVVVLAVMVPIVLIAWCGGHFRTRFSPSEVVDNFDSLNHRFVVVRGPVLSIQKGGYSRGEWHVRLADVGRSDRQVGFDLYFDPCVERGWQPGRIVEVDGSVTRLHPPQGNSKVWWVELGMAVSKK